ncbi:patatin-like phospholipase family protein [Roseibacterium beibuensis]|uniref:Patatin-like phospholipase family protein n=1 Tax=[Roseibacterium] beibuensis TaxID=1193142 RepID=A0ABP9LL96_9RHOB|nr:patatin-like phospholipase family protein [Roseibacterium beibuensis]MCS6625973.1 patatin-like phospholipase family protein [Roseibacterium beibuensis]
MARRPKIGLALGSGGARGWCHLGVLSVLDEMGVEADIVAGCSMGALVGAAEAGGVRSNLTDWALALTHSRFLSLVDLRLSAGGLVAGREIANVLSEWGLECEIESLSRSFTAVATRLDNGREIWLGQGPLLPAVRASLAIPGLFTPQSIDGHWLVDGGLTNPVPVSVARARGADVIIAVNPNAKPSGRVWVPEAGEGAGIWAALEQRFMDLLPQDWRPEPDEAAGQPAPQAIEAVNAALDMLTEYLRRTRAAADPPDVSIEVDLTDLSALSFFEAEKAIEAGRKAALAKRDQIAGALEAAGLTLKA